MYPEFLVIPVVAKQRFKAPGLMRLAAYVRGTTEKLFGDELVLERINLGIPEQAKGVVELYDVTEDWMPIYDKSDLPGFYMACGSSGNQFKNAPVAGKLMTALIEACEGGQDHDANPVQFHLENIGHDISLGAFSRNREINQNSSFSVIG